MGSMTQTIVGSAIAGPEVAQELARSERRIAAEGLVARMRGVPKGALKAVLGEELGEKAWRHSRGEARFPESEIADARVVIGLIRHLSQQAAGEMSRLGKHAKFVRLTIWHENGQSASARGRLAGLTQDAGQILEAALSLFAALDRSSSQVRAVDLDVTAVGEAVLEPDATPTWLTASPQIASA
jgi:impB/mucB/samB family protein